MSKTINHWNPVILSFLSIAAKHGLTPVKVDNGDGWEPVKDISEAVEEICAVDEAYVAFAPDENGKKPWAFIVLGNEPFESIADYSVHPALDKACDEFLEEWEGKPTPQRTSPY